MQHHMVFGRRGTLGAGVVALLGAVVLASWREIAVWTPGGIGRWIDPVGP